MSVTLEALAYKLTGCSAPWPHGGAVRPTRRERRAVEVPAVAVAAVAAAAAAATGQRDTDQQVFPLDR